MGQGEFFSQATASTSFAPQARARGTLWKKAMGMRERA